MQQGWRNGYSTFGRPANKLKTFELILNAVKFAVLVGINTRNFISC
jgi:hypothetical protein